MTSTAQSPTLWPGNTRLTTKYAPTGKPSRINLNQMRMPHFSLNCNMSKLVSTSLFSIYFFVFCGNFRGCLFACFVFLVGLLVTQPFVVFVFSFNFRVLYWRFSCVFSIIFECLSHFYVFFTVVFGTVFCVFFVVFFTFCIWCTAVFLTVFLMLILFFLFIFLFLCSFVV